MAFFRLFCKEERIEKRQRGLLQARDRACNEIFPFWHGTLSHDTTHHFHMHISQHRRKTYLEELRLHVLTGHQVGELEIQLDANGGRGHLDGTAWGRSRQVVEIHFCWM